MKCLGIILHIHAYRGSAVSFLLSIHKNTIKSLQDLYLICPWVKILLKARRAGFLFLIRS